MEILGVVPEHDHLVTIDTNEIIEHLQGERTLTEICEVWPGEEDELVDALNYLQEYLNGK